MGIEERIRVTGADQAAQDVNRVADATEHAGDATDQAGGKAKGAGGKFGGLTSILESAKTAAVGMVTGFMGMSLVNKLFSDALNALQKMKELSDEIAGTSVGLAGQSKLLGKQLGVGEVQGMKVLTDLRIAGGMDAGTAGQFGIAADVALGDQGGLLDEQNFEIAKEVAAFAGAKGFTGDEAAQLMGYLKTAGKLGSPEEAKRAMAQIAAAATASKAQSTGAFVAMLEKGGTGLLQTPGVTLEDVLTIGGQVRQVEVSEDLAAQSIKELEMVASGAEPEFTKEINRVADRQGLDTQALTTAQRVGIARQIFGGVTSQAEEDRVRGMMSAERSARLLKAFRASNVAATTGVAEAGRGATAEDFEATVEEGRQEMTFREQQSTAATEYQEAIAGRGLFTLQQARERAASKRKIAVAEGRRKEGMLFTPEAHVEEYLHEELMRRIEALQQRGVDLATLEPEGERRHWPHHDARMYARIAAGAHHGGIYGYKDEILMRMADIVTKAEAQLAAAGRPVTLNVTNIGANYSDVDPERRTPEPPYLGE